jgi:glucuronate isomerase
LLRKINVRVLCTTNDPFEKLEWHEQLSKKDVGFKVLPTFRPDKLFNLDKPGFSQAVALFEARFKIKIDSFEKMKTALSVSLGVFCALGCRLSDHAFSNFVYSDEPMDVDGIFTDALQGPITDSRRVTAYKSELLRFLFAEYSRRDMAAQLHLGALRNNSSRLFDVLGPDAGGDSVGMPTDIACLSRFMDDMDRVGCLPKTILYTLSSSEFTALSTMAVNFAHSSPARIQLGPAWWFQDSKRGMIRQIGELMETGLLNGFVGMVTDSRAFTSFCRHEYFRRILCNELGTLVENGEYPCDMVTLGQLVQDICYRNAVDYFGFEV